MPWAYLRSMAVPTSKPTLEDDRCTECTAPGLGHSDVEILVKGLFGIVQKSKSTTC